VALLAALASVDTAIVVGEPVLINASSRMKWVAYYAESAGRWSAIECMALF